MFAEMGVHRVPRRSQVVFLLDVDNTLIDNDRARELMLAATERILGTDLSRAYWRTYEEVREDVGFVDSLETLERFHALHPANAAALDRAILDFDYVQVRYPRTLAVLGLCAGAWLVAVSSEWRRELVIASMGHAGELILAGVLLSMALTGVGWRIPEIERPLGAFAAFFVQMQTLRFAWRLRHDVAFLAEYIGGKGGAMMNDLEVIALDLRIWTGASLDIREVAGWLVFLALVAPVAAVLLYVFRLRVHAAWHALLVLDRS